MFHFVIWSKTTPEHYCPGAATQIMVNLSTRQIKFYFIALGLFKGN